MTKFNAELFCKEIRNLLDRIDTEEQKNIDSAVKIIYNAMSNGKLLHVFCTGHSHMIAEEFFYRAGGLLPVNPILIPFLMQHEGAASSTQFERLTGVAEILFNGTDILDGEPMLIASNSGINSVPIEMAIKAKEKGLPVIVITSAEVSKTANSRHVSGKKLYEFGDVVIDTATPKGDSILEFDGGMKTGSVSSIISLYIVQKIVIGVVETFLKNGEEPPVFKSANLPNGDEFNKKLLEKYKGRIRSLY